MRSDKNAENSKNKKFFPRYSPKNAVFKKRAARFVAKPRSAPR
jgi:hypothetical protein